MKKIQLVLDIGGVLTTNSMGILQNKISGIGSPILFPKLKQII
ncbi:hypothetical protein SAMN04487944_11128 [Gracilibacillus ureilyticus]|uniref:Uncharacterized protein n=1 Tax=Gracilibacillus ureilyticus TaxID=531814 RepID=A0A1H9SGT9_9BACI|nr:hypothetical protein SAMN04487944_11128 [Gracilibacillus ureilyticus]